LVIGVRRYPPIAFAAIHSRSHLILSIPEPGPRFRENPRRNPILSLQSHVEIGLRMNMVGVPELFELAV
jgi:hypothetical protein